MIENFVFVIYRWFEHLGLFGSYLSMVIENIGIPLPTAIGYLIGQNLINKQIDSYFWVLTVLTLGHLTGALIAYSVGRWGDRLLTHRIIKWKKINLVHQKLHQWFWKYGNFAIFLTRFVGYFRPWSSFIAGFAGFPIGLFFVYTLLGSLIFNIFFLYLSEFFILVWHRYIAYHFVILVLISITFFAFIIWTLIKTIFHNKKAQID